MRMNTSEASAHRQRLTEQLYQAPYDVHLYLDRARCHEELGFPDLAVGDAYKALLLTDEAQDESGEYHAQALEVIEAYGGARLNECTGDKKANDDNGELHDRDNADHPVSHEAPIKAYALASFQLLSSNLLRCGCLKSALDYCLRGLQLNPSDTFLTEQRTRILNKNRQVQLQRDPRWDESLFDLKNDLPDEGSVRRELYPWNIHEPDRFSPASLSFLNAEMARVAPKCSVLAVDLPLLTEDNSTVIAAATIKQLGIFANEDIAPGETVLHEFSMLTANNRLHDPLCDVCSSELPPISSSQPLYACLECDDTVFCSLRCHDVALSSYHPSICGKELDFIGRETKPKDAANALYLLLLGRTMALAETQDLHPLELKETKYIWGDFIHPDSAYLHSSSASNFSIARHLPFSFTYNILSPLHILEKMDVDIFADLQRYDIWIFNTLYAKFRGTASARLNMRDGKPEVCAVHPMWCLANHSCAPNVRWEWGGEAQFWARGGNEVVRWGPHREEAKSKRWQGGIKKGEEILNHYCDVELDVKERREWAVGALGGMFRFVVHTGNFGDILAGYLAKRMGLPIAKIVIATSENDILDMLWKSSYYEKKPVHGHGASGGVEDDGAKAHLDGVGETFSPAMDILVSSNFERLLWLLVFQVYGEGPIDQKRKKAGQKVKEWLNELKSSGRFGADPQLHEAAKMDFESVRVLDKEILVTIRSMYPVQTPAVKTSTSNSTAGVTKYEGYILDSYSAIGVAASYRSLKRASSSKAHHIVLAATHPAKFSSAVELALKDAKDFKFADLLPEQLKGLKDRPRRQIAVKKSDGIER